MLKCGVKRLRVDPETLKQALDSVDEDSMYIDELVEQLVSSCCSSLDNYINYVKEILNDDNSNIPSATLDDIVMTIPSLLYFVGTQQEKLGIRHDVAKSTRNILFNQLFTKSVGTVNAKKAEAEIQLFNEDMATIVYDRAYNSIKTKVEFATEILQSAKKIISRRMAESDINKSSVN